MDAKDISIIKLLQESGRLSYADIGEQIALSITAVKERVKKLVQSNYISESLHVPNPEQLGIHLCAFVQVLMPVPDQEKNFIEKINLVEEIQECHFITGEYSYLLKIRVKNTKELERLISSKIKSIKGVSRTNTIIALTTTKETRKLKLSE